jgi:hypothetical protein
VRADLPPPNLHEHKLQNNPAEEYVLHPPVTTHCDVRCAAARNKNEGRRRTSTGGGGKIAPDDRCFFTGHNFTAPLLNITFCGKRAASGGKTRRT